MAVQVKMALVIYGSPRENGNTDILLKWVIKGIKNKDKNIRIDEIYLRDLNISPCRECRECDKTGQCVVDDDMQKIYVKLLSADYLILASPIFFYSVTAQTKAMIDRSQALWARKYLLKKGIEKEIKQKRGGWFISVGATYGSKLFDGVILTVRYFFDVLDIPYRGNLLIRGIDNKGEILVNPVYLSSAYNLGRKIASS